MENYNFGSTRNRDKNKKNNKSKQKKMDSIAGCANEIVKGTKKKDIITDMFKKYLNTDDVLFSERILNPFNFDNATSSVNPELKVVKDSEFGIVGQDKRGSLHDLNTGKVLWKAEKGAESEDDIKDSKKADIIDSKEDYDDDLDTFGESDYDSDKDDDNYDTDDFEDDDLDKEEDNDYDSDKDDSNFSKSDIDDFEDDDLDIDDNDYDIDDKEDDLDMDDDKEEEDSSLYDDFDNDDDIVENDKSSNSEALKSSQRALSNAMKTIDKLVEKL